MAASFCDLDGCVFRWGTNEYLPGARERLTEFLEAGNQIIFITNRESWVPGNLGTGLKKFLQKDFPGCGLIMGVESPRIIVNDEGAVAINHKKNAAFNHDLVRASGGR